MADPVIAQKAPFSVNLEAGKNYAWCACGRSTTQPFCDGSHKETDITPIVFKAEESKEVFLCGCKQTGSQPYCDGTHGKI
ncbi:MAG: CDGSH iron-sulfur domain-containing protein [Alphaproteobacteria bacterium]|nr:CDGSH iron-sulfur domain-containing protein [Alphaproteobacteria bacterium]